VENSFSDGHLVSLTNKNSLAVSTNPPASKTFEDRKTTGGDWNDSESSKNDSKDQREGKLK
jgi:hypothetical protein